ncbi:hypothetical protein [Psychrobacter aquimaris]|uniref:hypothetical protein n=1 Tax=Psychrobacter aquimaris TaxID=292733 RepID=UPI003FD413B6
MNRGKLLQDLLSVVMRYLKKILYKIEYSLEEPVFVPSNQDKKISKLKERNPILNLVNDFYYETCSIKNMPKIWWVLMLIDIIVLWLFFSSIDGIRGVNNPTFIQKNIPLLYGVVFISIFYILRKVNIHSILKKMQKKHEVIFENINDARIFWIQERLGAEIDFFELAKELSEWKTLREKHSDFFQYDYRKTIYNANAKPRVIALTIALISVCTLLIMNTSDVSYDEVVSQLATNIFYITVLSPIIVVYFLVLAFVITISWRVVLMFLDSFIDKGIVSNIRFGFLIEFLTTYSDLKKKGEYKVL